MYLREVYYFICEEIIYIYFVYKGFGLLDVLGMYKDYIICLKIKKC